MRAQFSGYPSTLVARLDQLILSDDKRIRPTIILLLGSIFKTERETLLDLAAAIEMMHIATRVHDDLSDRGGRPRGHNKISTRFTTSATILAGDFAFAAAAQLAAATKSIAVMRKFSETLQFIVNGEITYMFSNGKSCDQEAYYRWIHAKTASVFEIAAGMPAQSGFANKVEVSAAYQFGYNLGMAFQIADDVLDFTVVGCDTVPDQPERGGQAVVHIDEHLGVRAEQRLGGIKAARAAPDDGHARGKLSGTQLRCH